jgi:hypothetical protein
VLRALKPLIFAGVPIVVISIPHRKYDALKAERELTGRVTQIPVPPWDETELAEIAETGFPLLNVAVGRGVIAQFVAEALGSPHLMQEFCLAACVRVNVERTSPLGVAFPATASLDELFERVAEDTGRSIFDKLKQGPRQRTDRIERVLADGTTTDIYGAVLAGLASLKPGVESLTYEELRAAIRDVMSSQAPQANEITRVLEQMAKISLADESSSPVIDWEREESKLHVTDPFFAYFLRWGQTYEALRNNGLAEST